MLRPVLAVLTLTIGISANTAILSLANKPSGCFIGGNPMGKGGTGKAKAAKLPDAGISLKQCPEEMSGRKRLAGIPSIAGVCMIAPRLRQSRKRLWLISQKQI